MAAVNITPEINFLTCVNAAIYRRNDFACGSNTTRNLIKFNQSAHLSRRQCQPDRDPHSPTLTYPHSCVICTEISDTLNCSTGEKKPQTNSPIDCLHLRFISAASLSFSLTLLLSSLPLLFLSPHTISKSLRQN